MIYGGMLGKNGDKAPMSYDEVGQLVAGNFFYLLPHCITIVGAAYSGKPIDEALRLREAAKAQADSSDAEEKKTEVGLAP